MGRKRRASRISQKVYCFIVEGYTEENYIRLLKLLYRKSGDPKNCKGGNAKGVLKKAKKLIQQHGDDYSGYIVWFDGDKFSSGDVALRDELASRKDIETQIYINEPCVENWLLAHFQTILSHSASSEMCEKTLRQHIPHYKKNDNVLLKRYINKTHVVTAIVNYPEIGEIPKEYFIE